MNTRLLSLISIVGLLAALLSVAVTSKPTVAAPACPPSINFGEAIECSIDALAEIDTYIFVAQGGDKIKVRMTRISDTLRPRIRIYNSTGGEVCGEAYGNPTVEIVSCALVSAGTYSLRADDTYASNTGRYTLYIQRLNNPGNAGSITFGQTVTGRIDALAEIDTYTFVTEGDDNVKVRMSRTSDTLRPRIRIFNSGGNEVCGEAYGNPTVEIDSCTLISAGTYSILADDTYVSNTGDYTIYLQRLNQPPGDARSLTFGQTLTGTISALAEIDTYTFTVGVDDKVKVRMTRTSETLRPRIRIYNPTGEQVCGEAYGNPTVEIDSCKLVSAGTYTLLADDTYVTNTGNYVLYIQRLNKPGEVQPIRFGQTLSGTISVLAEIDTYTFVAAGDDRIRVRMTRTSDTLRPRIRIYNPTGDEVCGEAYGNPTVEIGDCLLRTAGTYSVLADDTYVSNIGSYILYLECRNAPCGPPIVYTNFVYMPVVVK